MWQKMAAGLVCASVTRWTLFCFLLLRFVAAEAVAQLPALNPPRAEPLSEPATVPIKPGPVPPPLPEPVRASPTSKPAETPVRTPSPSLVPTPEKLSEQATKLLRGLLPREFENRKKWGLTSRVVSGVDVDRDGLKIKTHRRWKEVNDGLWKRYHATLVDPNERFELQVVRIEEGDAGRVRMDVVLVAALDLEGRVVKYKRNLRLFSLTAHADAAIKLELAVELGASLDPTKLPPDIVFDVEVKDAKLDLVEFRLRRLSDIKGGVAERLGKLVEEIAEDEIKDQRVKLVEKLNKKIDKKSDQLRFSFHDLLPQSLQTNPGKDKVAPQPDTSVTKGPEQPDKVKVARRQEREGSQAKQRQ